MEELKKLIDLKSIITIIMVVSLCVAFFMNKITSEQFVPLVTMIITFYFAKKDSKEEPQNVEGQL